MARNAHHFPAVGDGDRFDAIVARGRSMRHRRQAVFGAATGSALAACVALVVLFGSSNRPAKSDQIFANEGKGDSPAPTTTAPPDKMQMTVQVNGKSIEVDLNDPRMPVPKDNSAVGETSYRSQQCVLLSLEDESDRNVAEGFGCQPFGPADTNSGTDAVTVQLAASDGVSLGCAAVEERGDPVATEPQQMLSRFSAGLPELPAGRYRLTVEAVSGFGDGCPDNPDTVSPIQPGDSTQPGNPGGSVGGTGTGTPGSNQVENSLAVQKFVTVAP